jgi:hypothetical protein
VLGDATPLVVEFLHSQRHADGGFCNRAGRSDLYYTVFGLEGLLALQQPLPMDELERYVRSFGDGAELDFIHIACLARCWSALPTEQQEACPRDALLARIEACRTPDGGYETTPGKPHGSLYGSFMAVGAYQDLKQPIPDLPRLIEFIGTLRDMSGGFQQSRALPMALVPSTAGAVALLRQLGERTADSATVAWLLSCLDEQGGFRPAPAAPMPDLLSTATALHALAGLKVDLGAAKDLCLDFVDSLWTNRGGFYGHWEDTHADCEYTYYALLALGHLSL